MDSKKTNNPGLHIGTQNISGGEVYNAAGDINVYQNKRGLSVQEFQDLLSQIYSEIDKSKLPQFKKREIATYLTTVDDAIKEKEPNKNLIVGPLSIALDLLIKAGGVAKATESIVPLIEKAIAFAQRLF